MSPPQLPFDVIESIIDEVAFADDTGRREFLSGGFCRGMETQQIGAVIKELSRYPTLKACALVSRDFLYLSRRHLFRSIVLDLNKKNGEPSYLRLCSVLAQSPEIARNIRHLSLNYHIPRSRALFSNRSKPLDAFQDTQLEGLLIKFDNITDFQMSLGYSKTNWTMIIPQIRGALFSLMCSTNLTHLHLDGIRELPPIFAELIAGVPNTIIDKVEFANNCNKVDKLHSLPAQCQRRLSNLVLPRIMHGQPDKYNHIVETLSSSNCALDKLTLLGHVWEGNITDMASLLLPQLGRRLKALSVDDVVDLSVCADITDITTCSGDLGDLRPVITTLSSARRDNHIRRIVINFDIGASVILTANGSSRVQSGTLSSWKALDTLLTSDSTFPELKQTCFYFPVGQAHSEYLMKPLVRALLPKAYEKGNFTVQTGRS